MELGDEQRDGTRGGLEQFKWESIKDGTMNERESYLGQSLKIGTLGRFGRFHKNDWWLKGRGELDDEKDTAGLRDFEGELLEEAIGAKPKRLLMTESERAEQDEQAVGQETLRSLDEEVNALMKEYMALKKEYLWLKAYTQRNAVANESSSD